MKTLSSKQFLSDSGLMINWSEKKDGSMKLANNLSENNAETRKNREVYFNKLNITTPNVVVAGLQHGSTVAVAKQRHAGKIILGADGLITKESNLFLSVTMADCWPIFFFDKNNGVIGLAHAGWRGLLKGIVPSMVRVFCQSFEGNPKNLKVIFGPGIQKCHFEFLKKEIGGFKNFFGAINERGGRAYVDLQKIALSQLQQNGVKLENVVTSDECTYCLKSKYFSFRRDKPSPLKAMVAVIGRK